MTLIKSISGIRGTIGGEAGDSLTPEDIVRFATAYGKWLLAREVPPLVVIGRDARISGQMVSQLVAGALQAIGISVIDLGLSTTPTVEIMVPEKEAGGGIIITASHNPKNWNALKLLNDKGEFISDTEGKKIVDLAAKGVIKYVKEQDMGTYTTDDTGLDTHILSILKLPVIDVEAIKEKDYKILVDGINSTGGTAVPKLLEALGVKKVIEHACEPTGNFYRNPEPIPENMSSLPAMVRKAKADMAIIVDPDVDRLAFICEDGTYFGEEYTLVAAAEYIMKKKRKGDTVSNLSSSRALTDITKKAKRKHHQTAVGEVNVVRAMKEHDAIIGGEGNGGIIYPELHYGRDALVGIALILTHLAKSNKSLSMLRATYPSYHISKNKIEVGSDIDLDAILKSLSKKYKKQPQDKIDGLKIQFNKEWVHLRRSNTEPIIRIYAESETETTAENLANKIMSDISTLLK
jgi:phosphomannomutase